MNRYNHPQKLTKMDYILRTLFLLSGIAILGVFCPRDSSLQLHYKLGEPWDNKELIAKDSFEIYKSESRLQSELDSMKRYYEPYYELQLASTELLPKRLQRELDSIASLAGMPLGKTVKVTVQLRKAYEEGILPDSSYSILQNLHTGYVHVYTFNESVIVPAKRLKSEKMVYEELMAMDSTMRPLLLGIKLDRYINPNLRYDAAKSINQQQEINQLVTIFSGRVQTGEKIVDKGQIVTPSIMEKLVSYERHEAERSKTQAELWSQSGGQLLYIAIAAICLFFFFHQFRSDYIMSLRHSLLIWIMVLFFPIVTFILVRHGWANPYIIPYCMLPIIIRVFMDSRTAFISHIISIMLCTLAIDKPFEFISVQITAGMTAIYALKQLQQRSDIFLAGLLVIGTSELSYLCLDLMHMNFFNIEGVKADTYIYIAINGGLLLLCYPLLFPLERMFQFTSMVTLVELSNVNNPLLRRLSEEAPGTFQHSMQVANLAAEVANKLGANVQLVRTAALYHDIGKLKNPAFFTENQQGVNPHSTLAYEDSAQIIIQHVKYGLELAGKHNLPESIKNFIATHHGRSKTRFFFISFMNQNPGKEVNEEIFTYPGPNPSTLEEAILMMADAVEAASRSLQDYSEESISNLVERIVDIQVKEGYFNRCPITFENISTCKEVFCEKLKSIYHTRISYPEMKK